MPAKILEGIRVVDLTWVLAGPYATRIFADWGAEVIKVQCRKTAQGAEDNDRGYFQTWNRNKKSITLNQNYPAARELLLKLIAASDLVIENFSPRVMSNWKLTYRDLQKVKSDVIMLSMSAAGQTGPGKDWVAFAHTLQALSGFTFLTSFAAGSPLGLGVPYGDVISALYAAFAALAALEYRDRTGQGQYIDLSEYEALCSLLGPAFLDELANGRKIMPQGNGPDDLPAAPHGCFKCLGTDRWCVIAVFSDEEWQALCGVMGRPAWAGSETLSTMAGRRERAAELEARIEEWTARKTAEEVVQLLQDAGVAAGLVQNAEDLAHDPQLLARKFFRPLPHPMHPDALADASPIQIDGERGGAWKAAPLLGEHNRYVFLDLLGLTEEEFSAYVKQGVIG
jgi:crotonobetainyl-CoA:carnitine CoA-transferase CaiB-like acyl-CoA transferase